MGLTETKDENTIFSIREKIDNVDNYSNSVVTNNQIKIM